jgi:hypothetical protein
VLLLRPSPEGRSGPTQAPITLVRDEGESRVSQPGPAGQIEFEQHATEVVRDRNIDSLAEELEAKCREVARREENLVRAEELIETERARIERRAEQFKAREADLAARADEIVDREAAIYEREQEIAEHRAKVEVDIELESERLDRWEQELKLREARLEKKEVELDTFIAHAQGELGRREAALRSA